MAQKAGRWSKLSTVFCGCLTLSVLVCHAQRTEKKGNELQFKKTALSREFIAEGATVIDVNKDGKKDVV
ncbi:hypothetical protein ACFQ4C_29545, partial [Larkinella insperata]